jgi:polysaccharide export outer membrane protein
MIAFKNRFGLGGMVNTIWAVACAVMVLMGGVILSGGCASTKSEVTGFSRMDVGEGPGATLKKLTELQKDLGGPHASTDLDKKDSAVPPFNSRNVSPPTEIDRKPSQKEHGTNPVASVASSEPRRATSGTASSKTPVVTEVPPAKPSESSRKEVPQSSQISRKDDDVKKQTTKSRTVLSSGATTNNIPVADAKPMSDTKKGESMPPPTAPSKSVPPSGNPEPPEKEVPRQASVAKIPPATPLPSSTAGKVAPSDESQYRIGPEDILIISVWGNEQLTMDVIVRPDGKISIPLVQDIQAEGFTASELADRIHERLLPYIKDPNVSVIVKQINAPKFSVIGYVNRPGTYPMRGDVTILQALSEAGGFTPFASPRKIKLVRNAGGKQEIKVVNYYDIIKKGGKGNLLLMPGDAIVVP